MRAPQIGERIRLLAAPVQPGAAARLFLFAWSLAIVMLAPPARVWLAALLALCAAACFYPAAIGRAFRPRWLLLLALMALPSLFVPGPPALQLGDAVAISSEGLLTALRTLLRAFVMLVAVDGLAAAVDVAQIAALFERCGLQGLGFAVGVALNLLPILRDTTTVTWQSLRMRGGLRRQPLRGLRYFFVTVISSALRRAADIALAAEARAYTPANSRPTPLQSAPADKPLVALATLLLLMTLFFP